MAGRARRWKDVTLLSHHTPKTASLVVTHTPTNNRAHSHDLARSQYPHWISLGRYVFERPVLIMTKTIHFLCLSHTFCLYAQQGLTAVGATYLTLAQTLLVVKARRNAKVAYPQLYAENAEAAADPLKHKFNCVQRAHQVSHLVASRRDRFVLIKAHAHAHHVSRTLSKISPHSSSRSSSPASSTPPLPPVQVSSSFCRVYCTLSATRPVSPAAGLEEQSPPSSL